MQAFILKLFEPSSDRVINQQTINSELVYTDEKLTRKTNVAQNNKQKFAPEGGKDKRLNLH